MVKFTTTSIQVCAYIFLAVQVIAIAVAFKKASNIDEYNMMKNHRTRMRQNYIVQKTNNDVSDNIDDIGTSLVYPADSESDTSPEELPALIVDYANMIRNDIILMDNTVQTRTRKRGNIKTGRHSQVVPEVSCSCEDGKTLQFLGEDYVPHALEVRTCNKTMCTYPYACRTRIHNVTVLKRRKNSDEISQEDLPDDLRRWVAVHKPVTTGCVCSRSYIDVY